MYYDTSVRQFFVRTSPRTCSFGKMEASIFIWKSDANHDFNKLLQARIVT